MKKQKIGFVSLALAMFGLTLFLFGLSEFNFFEGAELYLYQNVAPARPLDSKIVIVQNDLVFATEEERRGSLAELIRATQNKLPLVLGVITPLSTSLSQDSSTDKALAKAISASRHPLVFSVETSGVTELPKRKLMVAKRIAKPLRIFSDYQNVSLGHTKFIDETGSWIKRFPMSIGRQQAFANDAIGQSEFYDAFGRVLVASAKVVEKYKSRTSSFEEIVFINGTGAIPRVLLSDVIKSDDTALEKLSGKIVLTDFTFASTTRKVRTFFETKQLSDLEIHAQVANMFIQGYSRATLPPLQLFLRLLVACLIPLLVYYSSRKLWLASTTSIILLIIYVLSARYAFAQDLAFPLAQMSLSLLLGLFVCVFYAKAIARHEPATGTDADERSVVNES